MCALSSKQWPHDDITVLSCRNLRMICGEKCTCVTVLICLVSIHRLICSSLMVEKNRQNFPLPQSCGSFLGFFCQYATSTGPFKQWLSQSFECLKVLIENLRAGIAYYFTLALLSLLRVFHGRFQISWQLSQGPAQRVQISHLMSTKLRTWHFAFFEWMLCDITNTKQDTRLKIFYFVMG